MTADTRAAVLTARRAAQHFRLSVPHDAYEYLCILTLLPEPSPVSALCWQMHRLLTVLVSLLRVWVHCPRASNGPLPRRSNLVGYVQWDAQFDRFLLVKQSLTSSFPGHSVRWDARSDRVPPLPSSQARLLAPSPLRTVRNTFALHGSSTQQRPHNERGRSLIQVQLRPTRYWLTADSHGDGKIHQACGKPHQRLAPSSFALLPASVP